MKTKKLNWKAKLKNAVVGTVLGLVALVSGCGSNNKFIDEQIVKKPYVETAFVSDYVAKHGYILEGQNRQDFVNLNLNDRLSGFIWQGYSHADNTFCERDYGISYSIPINDKFSVSTGYQYWHYPHDYFGKDDQVLKAGANYAGPVNLDLEITQLLPHDNIKSGTRYYFKASKNFPIGKIGDIDFSLTPSISTAYIDNYYANTGHSQITPGISLGARKGNVNLNFFVNSQDGKMSGIKDKNWGGISLGYKF